MCSCSLADGNSVFSGAFQLIPLGIVMSVTPCARFIIQNIKMWSNPKATGDNKYNDATVANLIKRSKFLAYEPGRQPKY